MAGAFFRRISAGIVGLCASKNRYGEPCGSKQVVVALSSGKPRCRFHGCNGKQAPPTTPEARLRSWANLSGPRTKEGRERANKNLLLSRRRNPKLRGTPTKRERIA